MNLTENNTTTGGKTMKLKRLLSLGLSAALLTSLLAACGSGDSGTSTGTGSSSGSTGSDSSSSVEVPEGVTSITWYYPIDTSGHHDKAWEEINAYLAEEIGVVVDYKPIAWGEYDTKTNAIKTSGQEFDIMFDMGGYAASVDLGVAQPIEGFLDTAGADMQSALPDTLWDSVTIDGSIYGVPTYKDNATIFGLIYNKTVADEIGMTMPTSLSLNIEDLDAFYREVHEKMVATYGEDHDMVVTLGMEMLDVFEQHATRAAISKIDGGPMFQDKGDGEVFDLYREQEVTDYYKVIRAWVEDGVMPFDAKNVEKDPIKGDGTLFSEFVQGFVDFPADGWSNEYETGFIMADTVFMTTGGASFGTNIVGAKSSNPEAAVKFLNLMNTDPFVANTLRFGIEGEYYNVVDDRITFDGTVNEDPSARAYYNWYGWQFGNIFAMNLPAQENDDLFVNIMAANEDAVAGQHMGYTADTSNLLNELAGLEAAYVEYRDNLNFGMLADVDAAVAELDKKVTSAGVDTVIEEIQVQVNEWRTENGLEPFEG